MAANGAQDLYQDEDSRIAAAKAKKLKLEKEAEYLAELEKKKKRLLESSSDE